MLGSRSVFVIVLVALSLDASTSSATAKAPSLLPIAPSQVKWAGGDPASGSDDASAAALSWGAGESARQAVEGQKTLWASVPVPEGDWLAPTLLLEGVGGRIELWFNGRSYPVPATNEITDLCAVLLPPAAVGQRVQLRVASEVFPASLSRMSIGEQAHVTEVLLRRGLAASVVGLLMMVLAVAALGGWLMTRREERFSLRVLAFCGVAGVMAFGLAPASPLMVGASLQVLAVYLGVALFPWATLAMVRVGFPKHAPKWTVWIARLALVWGLFLVLAKYIANAYAAAGLAPAFFAVTLGISLFIAIKATRARHPDGPLLLGGMAIFFSLIAYDLFGIIGVSDASGFHVHWGLLVMTGAFVGMFARRMSEAAQLLRTQTQALEAREKEGRAVTEHLLADATELLAAVAQLRDSGSAQNQSIEKQAAALQETHVTAEEIRRTSALASEKAQDLIKQAGIADETQRAGERAVEESLAALASIREEVAAMAGTMSGVDALAQEIGGIVDVVNELADQSNMLALNAAIEAVRSGEHGKGFAVVAREVRRLADQSIQSTGRIRDALERLTDGVRQSTWAGERGEKTVATALKRLQASGAQMRSMSDILRETNAAVRQISAAVTQQNAGISQIFTAVEHLSDQMTDAVQRVQEAESATAVVETVASRMSEKRQAG